MKISVAQSPKKIAVDGCLAQCMKEKEIKISLTITDENDEFRSETIINRKEAEHLVESLTNLLNDPILEQTGFKIV